MDTIGFGDTKQRNLQNSPLLLRWLQNNQLIGFLPHMGISAYTEPLMAEMGWGALNSFCVAIPPPISCPSLVPEGRSAILPLLLVVLTATTSPLALISSLMGWVSQLLQCCQCPPRTLLQGVTCPPGLNTPSGLTRPLPAYLHWTCPYSSPRPYSHHVLSSLVNFPFSHPSGKCFLMLQSSAQILCLC